MHIKFISTGRSAKSAYRYLYGKRDHKGEVRHKVETLRGNPEEVTELAESLDFKHTYRSAVIAWGANEAPTPEQMDEALDEFERVAFAGLEGDQYTYYAVLHEEADGSKHIHIIVPRVELQTGKSMNIAPPGWQKRYDLVRDKLNAKYAWASPKDIAHRKLAKSGHFELKSGMRNAEIKRAVTQLIEEKVKSGELRTHDDIVKAISRAGEVTRTGVAKNGVPYLSFKPFSKDGKPSKKAIRLSGHIYGRDFDYLAFKREIEADRDRIASISQADRAKEVAELEAQIVETVQRLAEYNKSRYVRQTDDIEVLATPSQGEIHDRDRDEVEQIVRDARESVHRGISQGTRELRGSFNADRDSLRNADERSETHHREAVADTGTLATIIKGLASAVERVAKSIDRVVKKMRDAIAQPAPPPPKPAKAHYELLADDTIEVDGRTLYRIRATRDSQHAKSGDLGGYVENYRSLRGDAWCDADSRIYGDGAVLDRASVSRSIVCDGAMVCDTVMLIDCTAYGVVLEGNATHIGKALTPTTYSGQSQGRDQEISHGLWR